MFRTGWSNIISCQKLFEGFEMAQHLLWPNWPKPDAPLSKTWQQTRNRNLMFPNYSPSRIVCACQRLYTSCYLTGRHSTATVLSPQSVKCTAACFWCWKIPVQEEADHKNMWRKSVNSWVKVWCMGISFTAEAMRNVCVNTAATP